MGRPTQYKIGKDVTSTRKRITHYGGQANPHYKRLGREIEKIKRVEQLDIVEKMLKETYSWGKLSFEEVSHLYSKLNEQAAKVGEIRRYFKIGGFEVGGEKKRNNSVSTVSPLCSFLVFTYESDMRIIRPVYFVRDSRNETRR